MLKLNVIFSLKLLCWRRLHQFLIYLIVCCSNRSRTPPTSTSPTCQCPWTSRSWRACSSPSARSSPRVSWGMPTGPAAAWDLPGGSRSHHMMLSVQFVLYIQRRAECSSASSSLYVNNIPREGTEFLTWILFQNGVHREVWGNNSAFQWEIHKDSTRSAWWVQGLVSRMPDDVVVIVAVPRWIHCPVWSVAFTVPTEPLLCKFADGGQKKRQNQGKYLQNGRPWARDGDTVTTTGFNCFLPGNS